jgi:acyl-CoA thioesterase 8
MTDFQFIGTAARALGLTRTSTPRLGMLASLDHSVHYYPIPLDFDPREPLLHVMESSIADVGPGRGVVRGLLYTRQGRILAATGQEGVVRADLGRGERGLVEGGGMGGDDAKEDAITTRAKL